MFLPKVAKFLYKSEWHVLKKLLRDFIAVEVQLYICDVQLFSPPTSFLKTTLGFATKLNFLYSVDRVKLIV